MYIRPIKYETGKTYFAIKQMAARREFLEFIKNYYDKYNFLTKIKDFMQSDKYLTSELTSLSSKELGDQRKRWYPNGIKIVPRDLKLNPEIIAFWFQGDGEAGRDGLDKHSVKAAFSTNSFTLEDVNFLRDQLKELGIESTIRLKRGKEHIITIAKATEVKKLMDMIKPYILPCFQYKLQYPNLIDFGDQVEKQRIRSLDNYHNMTEEEKKKRNRENWSKRKEIANPERNKKYHDDLEYQNKCKARSKRNYKPHPRIREITPCIFCKSTNTRKHGKIVTQTSSYSRIKCNDCGKLFQHNKTQIMPSEK